MHCCKYMQEYIKLTECFQKKDSTYVNTQSNYRYVVYHHPIKVQRNQQRWTTSSVMVCLQPSGSQQGAHGHEICGYSSWGSAFHPCGVVGPLIEELHPLSTCFLSMSILHVWFGMPLDLAVVIPQPDTVCIIITTITCKDLTIPSYYILAYEI